MLVEINLLPKKEPKNYTSLIVSIVLLIITIAVSVYFYFTYDQQRNESLQLQQQIDNTKKIAGIEQSKKNAAERNDSVQKLQTYIQWSKAERVETVPLLVQMIGLLPERGYFMNFNYVTEGSIQLSVQFDTSREAADYLNSLLSTSWISNVQMTSLTTTTNPYDREMQNQSVGANQNKQALLQGSSDAYIPRYLAVYTVTINKSEALKLASSSQTANEKGAK